MSENNLKKTLSIPLASSAHKVRIYHFDSVNSVFDTAFALFENKVLTAFDSVLADSQQAGRGQMRRHWFSPPGNLYAALLLPNINVFKKTCATPYLGFLCAYSLRNLGWPILLKWPNDLILVQGDDYGKVGGILLEERGNALVAGIGINVQNCPDRGLLRKEAAMNAAFLGQSAASSPTTLIPMRLWSELVKQIFSIYKASSDNFDNWQAQYDKILLWRNMLVEARDGSTSIKGRLMGLTEDGAILIATENGLRKCFGGDLNLVRNN